MGSAKTRATWRSDRRFDDRISWPAAERTAPDLACVIADGRQRQRADRRVSLASRHDLRLTTRRQARREARSRHMIAAEGLVAAD